MFNFSEFLAERAIVKKTTSAKKKDAPVKEDSNLNDDKGKLAELYLAHHLGKHLTQENQRFYPSHFRETERTNKKGKIIGGTPQQVEKRIIDRRGKDLQGAVDSHSAQTSEAIIEHLIKTGKIRDRKDIEGVHWTSNADTINSRGERVNGDHAKVTDEHDPNQKGDLILSIRNQDGSRGFVPISAKYGSENKPNYANWGLERLSRETGISQPTNSNLTKLEQMKQDQDNELEKTLGHVYGNKANAYSAEQKHELFKKDRDLLDSKKKEDRDFRDGKIDKKTRWTPSQLQRMDNAQTAYNISLKHRRKMAGEMANAFNEKTKQTGSDQHIRDFISKSISDKTKFPTVIAHSKTDNKNPYGDSESRVYDQDDVAPHVLSNYEGIHAKFGSGEEDDDGAISVHFYGKNKKTGAIENIATQSLKSGSGPYKGIAGSFRIQHVKNENRDQQVNAPSDRIVKDKETGEQHILEPTVPNSATVWGPRKMLSQFRTAVPPQQRRVTQTDSPFQSMQRPGIKRPPPSQRMAQNGYPEHMHQAHKDNTFGGFQDTNS